MPPRQAEREAPPFPGVAHPDVPLLSLPELLLLRAATSPDKAAIIDGPTGRVTTYGQLAQAATRTAAGLAERGFGKGDVLAICSSNLPEYAVAVLGAGLAGGIVSTINPLYTAIELTHQLRDSRARVLVVGERFAAKAAEAVPKTLVQDLFVFGEEGGLAKTAGVESPKRRRRG